MPRVRLRRSPASGAPINSQAHQPPGTATAKTPIRAAIDHGVARSTIAAAASAQHPTRQAIPLVHRSRAPGSRHAAALRAWAVRPTHHPHRAASDTRAVAVIRAVPYPPLPFDRASCRRGPAATRHSRRYPRGRGRAMPVCLSNRGASCCVPPRDGVPWASAAWSFSSRAHRDGSGCSPPRRSRSLAERRASSGLARAASSYAAGYWLVVAARWLAPEYVVALVLLDERRVGFLTGHGVIRQ
jgi:hypothetical protein